MIKHIALAAALGLALAPTAHAAGDNEAVRAMAECRHTHPERSLPECEQPVFAAMDEAKAIIAHNFPELDTGLNACQSHFIRQDESTNWEPIYERGFGACAVLNERYDALLDQLTGAVLRVHRQRDLDAVRHAQVPGAQ